MKKNIIRMAVSAAVLIILLCAFSVICSAEKKLIAEGYCISGQDGSGKPVSTNVKWEVYDEDGVGVIYFNIDKSVESQNTVLHTRQKDGSDLIYWNDQHYMTSPWGEYTVGGKPTVKKAIIGDGITELDGAPFCGSRVETVEMPRTVVRLKNNSFAKMSSLRTVNITGEAENPNVINMKYVTGIVDGNTFEGITLAKKYILNPDYAGAYLSETFKQNTCLSELEIPAGVTKLGKKLFNETNNLARLIILGKDTEMTEETFEGMEAYPRIIGYIGSKAEEFAKANGFTFIDIETEKEVHKGTKPLAEALEAEPFVPVFEVFDPAGATAYGHMTGTYDLISIVDTYWAYYADTKTLKLISATKEYNETGSSKFFDDKAGWNKYTEEIEHLIIGDYINKFSDALCAGMINLKDVEMSQSITQMNTTVFKGCSSLTTIYYRGRERVEGVADFTTMKLDNSVEGTAFKVLKLGEKNESLEGIVLPGTLETIITPHFDAFDSFCRENMYDLQDAKDPENVKNYCVRVALDPTWVSCGTRAAYEFDKTTGTLTIHGVGYTKDITNFHGGGSKHQPWFDIKDDIKHIVITEYIQGLGRYSFAQCRNIETVQLPNVEKFTIGNASFEGCYNLKSIYIEGNEPIEGTLDLSIIKDSIPAWTFAYNYLIANVIVDSSVKKIGTTTFEENLGLNLSGIYGTPGSYAEKYAEKNGLDFYDISKEQPKPVTCTLPDPEDTGNGEDTSVSDPNTPDIEREYNIILVDDLPGGIADVPDNTADGAGISGMTVAVIIVVSLSAVIVIAAAAGIIIIKKKSSQK